MLNNVDKFIEHSDNIYTLDIIEMPFFSFIAKNPYTGKDNMFIEKLHCDLRIQDKNIIKEKQEIKQLENKIIENKIKQIEKEFKVKDLSRLEDLRENTKYTITHINTVEYRGKPRYGIVFFRRAK